MTKFNKDISYNDLPLLPPKKNLETIEVLGLSPYDVCMVDSLGYSKRWTYILDIKEHKWNLLDTNCCSII